MMNYQINIDIFNKNLDIKKIFRNFVFDNLLNNKNYKQTININFILTDYTKNSDFHRAFNNSSNIIKKSHEYLSLLLADSNFQILIKNKKYKQNIIYSFKISNNDKKHLFTIDYIHVPNFNIDLNKNYYKKIKLSKNIFKNPNYFNNNLSYFLNILIKYKINKFEIFDEDNNNLFFSGKIEFPKNKVEVNLNKNNFLNFLNIIFKNFNFESSINNFNYMKNNLKNILKYIYNNFNNCKIGFTVKSPITHNKLSNKTSGEITSIDFLFYNENEELFVKYFDDNIYIEDKNRFFSFKDLNSNLMTVLYFKENNVKKEKFYDKIINKINNKILYIFEYDEDFKNLGKNINYFFSKQYNKNNEYLFLLYNKENNEYSTFFESFNFARRGKFYRILNLNSKNYIFFRDVIKNIMENKNNQILFDDFDIFGDININTFVQAVKISNSIYNTNDFFDLFRKLKNNGFIGNKNAIIKENKNFYYNGYKKILPLIPKLFKDLKIKINICEK